MEALNAYGSQSAMPYVGQSYASALIPSAQFAPQQVAQVAPQPLATNQLFSAVSPPDEMAANSANSSAATALAEGITSAAQAAETQFSGGCCKLNYLA